MTQFKFQPKVTFEIFMAMDEAQARALDALAGYGEDEFIKHFYDHLGKAYMERHEDGLRSLLREIRRVIPSQLHKVDMARRALTAPEPPQ